MAVRSGFALLLCFAVLVPGRVVFAVVLDCTPADAAVGQAGGAAVSVGVGSRCMELNGDEPPAQPADRLAPEPRRAFWHARRRGWFTVAALALVAEI